MRITKYGHSCLYVEEGQARILIDPGTYTFMDTGIKPEDLPECNVLLLTHEHQDHAYPEALKVILQKNKPVIFTNAGVSAQIFTSQKFQSDKLEINVMKPGEERVMYGVSIRTVACEHGFIAEHIPRPENIGFLIGGRLFHPGDCVAPSEAVQAEILAVPVVAPWMAVREGLEFVKKIKPKFAIPIHDAFVKWPETPWYRIFQTGLENTGIEFITMKIGEAREF